jgi:predicted AlkP superfamily phosphohydrolase/phosphomutase
MRVSRYSLPVLTAATLAAGVFACHHGPAGKPLRRAKQKVVIMGFDGMDPTLAQRFMDQGKLPNLKRLAESGTFSKLETTQPSESPVAWASFATGANPGKHNIYDFLTRNLETYMPQADMGVKKEPPEFLWGLFPTKLPKVTSTRGGTSFWVHAGRDGIKSVVLTVPMTFPPEPIAQGQMLSGLPLPDLRATLGTYSLWSTDPAIEEGSGEFGGNAKRLSFENGVAHTSLKGPTNPILAQEERELRQKSKTADLSEKERARLDELGKGKDISPPMDVRWTRGSAEADVEIQGTKLHLKIGEWTDWVPLAFKINIFKSVHGITQFYLIRADEELKIYASPVNMDPRNPPLPISKPDGFSAELTEELGLYRTLGWAEASDKALQDQRVDEALFLSDCERAFADRERIILKNLDRKDWDLFVAAIETTDRVSHMMWRLTDTRHPMYDADLAAKYGNAIEKIYERADGLVGKIQAKLPPDATFIVMSDHGFHSFRRSVNINTWLVQNCYLVFEGQGCLSPTAEGQKKTLDDLFGHGKFWEGVDWSKTRAYAVGLGQIYFNLRGRESQGIVSAGAEYTALQNEIASKLVQVKDPDDGMPVMRAVYKRDDVYKGDYLENAPDLQPGFNDGYRVGWQDTLGVIRRSVVENNNRKWSGDHCATAAEISGGVLFINRKVPPKPHIMDLAPTVLKLLEVPLPDDLDGKPLL